MSFVFRWTENKPKKLLESAKFRILRPTFHRKSASKSWIQEQSWKLSPMYSTHISKLHQCALIRKCALIWSNTVYTYGIPLSVTLLWINAATEQGRIRYLLFRSNAVSLHILIYNLLLVEVIIFPLCSSRLKIHKTETHLKSAGIKIPFFSAWPLMITSDGEFTA